MRQKKQRGPRDAVRRKMNTIAGLRVKRLKIRSDYDDELDAEDIDDHGGVIHVFEKTHKSPEFTGILTEYAEPIFRFFMPKPQMGFQPGGIDYFDPDAYMYGLHPDVGPLDDEDGDNDPDEDEQEYEEDD